MLSASDSRYIDSLNVIKTVSNQTEEVLNQKFSGSQNHIDQAFELEVMDEGDKITLKFEVFDAWDFKASTLVDIYIAEPLAIDKKDGHFHIYPNPVRDYLIIKGSEIIKEMTIYNLGGINKGEWRGNVPSRLDLRDFTPGLYFLKMFRDGKVETVTIIKY